MPVSRDDVIAAYEMILGRSPESEEVVTHHAAAHADRLSLGLSILASDEAKLRAGIPRADWLLLSRMGVDLTDAPLLSAVADPGRKPEPGFFVDFLGQRTRASFLADGEGWSGRVGDPPLPGDFHADAAEWVAFIKVISSTSGGFVAAELGAGWGPWTAAAYALARKYRFAPLKLYAVEADPGFFGRMQQHLSDNAVPPEVLDLRNAVVTSGGDGPSSWSLRDASGTDYGARAPEEGREVDYRGLPTGSLVELPSLSLPDFLREEPLWNLIHIDLQGIEEELCRAAMPELSARAQHVLVATHTKALDAGCFEAFHAAGWICLMNAPPVVSHEPSAASLQAMTRIDGMQLWRNRRLFG